MLLNDLMKQFNESVGETGPKFTGYWKGKDAAPPVKKMVGSESINNEAENPTDVISVDVPLFLRLMEYAKEDAKTDMDLHDVTERAIELMKQGDHLSMEHYDSIVGGQATGGEQSVSENKKYRIRNQWDYTLHRFEAPSYKEAEKIAAEWAQNYANETGKNLKYFVSYDSKKDIDELKDTAKYGNDNSSNINQEIFQLLKSGATVFSNAAGRMGQVISANNDGVTIKSKRGKGFTSFNSGDKVKIQKVEGKPNHYHVVNTMNEGWKDVAKVGAALGIAGGMGLAGKYADDHAQRVQIGNTQAYVITNPSAGTIPPNAEVVKGADGKMYKVWIKGGEPRTGSTKNMFATPVSEGKIKGKDGKACWKGYRYAGTENGKDKCVPVKKG